MLIIVNKGQEQTVRDIFEKWDLPYAEVGVVKDDGMMRVRDRRRSRRGNPGAASSRTTRRFITREATPRPRSGATAERLPEADPLEALPALLAHPSIASKNWVYRQYDHMVRAGTCVLPGRTPRCFWSARRTKSWRRPAIATRSIARSTRARARDRRRGSRAEPRLQRGASRWRSRTI